MQRRKIVLFLLLALVLIGIGTETLFAQEAAAPAASNAAAIFNQPNPTTGNLPAPSMVEELTAITALALLPFAVMLLTSYIKIVVVLSLLRNALGVPTISTQPGHQRDCPTS